MKAVMVLTIGFALAMIVAGILKVAFP